MASCHVRSISLPSRSHPLVLIVEEQLCNLKASQSSSVCHKLAGVKDLYECVNDFLTQKNLSNTGKSECVEEILNGSLRLLDLCNNTRDVLSRSKESRARRRKSCLTSEIDAYMAARKKLSKDIRKCLKNLKRKENNAAESSSEEIKILKNVEETSFAVLEDILCFIPQPKSNKSSGWSIVSKQMQSKCVSCQSNAQISEVEKIDAELLVLKSNKVNDDDTQVQNVLKGLKSVESSIQQLEEELECVYKRMVKARVSQLNIINH